MLYYREEEEEEKKWKCIALKYSTLFSAPAHQDTGEKIRHRQRKS